MSTIYIDLPTGDGYGRGVCGDNIANALAAIAPTTRLPKRIAQPTHLPGPLLQKIDGAELTARNPDLTAERSVGYVVFEDDLVARRAGLRLPANRYSTIATGSQWCSNVLRESGLTSVVTVHHGVDAERFYPHSQKELAYRDRFVIFSGGKFELRKGQDIVAKAFRIFSERHDDAFLMVSWHNAWPTFVQTMAASPYLPFHANPTRSQDDDFRCWLKDAGIDLDRVIFVPPQGNASMSSFYWNTDVGLFPNRCEGATNLVLMEYMACGRPAIVTDFAGHHDLVGETNSWRLRSLRPLVITRDGAHVACWCEPSLDEVLRYLEEAYSDRDELSQRGARAGVEMTQWTWRRAAESFLSLLKG
jgi:glycosyltransferase involved in cell wall biosynthesis